MTEADIEIILERAKERYPGVKPRIISDNGPQFIAKDFKEFIRISGMTHVRTSPYYPQSNGKNREGLISLCISLYPRPFKPSPCSRQQAPQSVNRRHFNHIREYPGTLQRDISP